MADGGQDASSSPTETEVEKVDWYGAELSAGEHARGVRARRCAIWTVDPDQTMAIALALGLDVRAQGET